MASSEKVMISGAYENKKFISPNEILTSKLGHGIMRAVYLPAATGDNTTFEGYWEP